MRAVSSLSLLALSACLPGDSHGDPYGVYTVVGTLSAHECGQEAAPIALPYHRTFELRRMDSGLAYLLGSDGSIMEGSLGANGAFRFSDQSWVRVIEPEEVLEIRGCDLVVTLSIEGTAERTEDEDSEAHSLEPLEGQLVTRIAPSAGSDCSELLYGSASGGLFHALPCRIVLDLEGTPQPRDDESDSTDQ